MLHSTENTSMLKPSLDRIAREIDALFEEVLAADDGTNGRLRDAMHHAAVGGGGTRTTPILPVLSW